MGAAHVLIRRVQVSEEERKAIAASFSDKSEVKSVISSGIKVSGEKYMTIEAGDDALKAKKVRPRPHSNRMASMWRLILAIFFELLLTRIRNS